MSLAVIQNEELLKETTSRCTVCFERCPAQVVKEGSSIFLVRTCVKHGRQSYCISSDARFYWLSRGNSSCCAGEACSAADPKITAPLGKNAARDSSATFESLSTCLALIEIVNSCNLPCPTCFANSPLTAKSAIDAVPISELKNRIQGVLDRKGKIEILQLSGGEPTIHPQFFELVDWVKANSKIDYLLINTNGVRVATDDSFLAELGERVKYDNLQLYLQYDGPQAEGQMELRGTDLRALKQKAIERCGSIALPLTFAMTVTKENINFLWKSVEFGLRFPNVRGISFQPLFLSGRTPYQPEIKTDPISTADIMLSCVENSQGKLSFEDFTPLPCGDPNCATIGYLLKVGDRVRSISDFVDFSSMQGFLNDRVRYSLEDLKQCGCESQPLGQLLKQFELDESHTFRLFIKPFMDARSWDQDRIDRCCTHVIRPDGKLDSFCRYYSGFSDCTSNL